MNYFHHCDAKNMKILGDIKIFCTFAKNVSRILVECISAQLFNRSDYQYMKIFTAVQIRELDKYTIEHEPIASIDLMERAAENLTKAIIEEYGQIDNVVVFAGPGNNGGDALAVARMLLHRGYNVSTYLFNIGGHLSEDCETNKKRLTDDKLNSDFIEVTTNFDPPKLDKDTLVVDGLFGTGLKKPLEGGFAALVKYINSSPSTVVSIDIPSGLMTEDNTYNVRSNIVRADVTLTLQQKKLSMMFAENSQYVGRLRILDIGLSQEYIDKTDCMYTTIDVKAIAEGMLLRSEFAHKGTMGNALLMAGSYGMSGAAVLAARACMRSGVGKTTVQTARENRIILQTAVPEAILRLDDDNEKITEDIDTDSFDAMGVGPGIGTNEDTAIALLSQLRQTKCPIVVDADAINILATHRAWIQQLPDGLIFTPHPKELDRLVGTPSASDYDRLTKARELAERFDAYILLKGHYTALCSPDGRVVFNTSGNAGMATAGSGDVLTGLLTALLARGYELRKACLTAMYLHGLAGDIAAQTVGKESLVASDIVSCLPKAFMQLEQYTL